MSERGVSTLVTLNWPIKPTVNDDWVSLECGEDSDNVFLSGEGAEHANQVIALGHALVMAGTLLKEQLAAAPSTDPSEYEPGL